MLLKIQKVEKHVQSVIIDVLEKLHKNIELISSLRCSCDWKVVSFSVTPKDQEKILEIEKRIGKELEVMEVDENEHILPLMMTVSVGKKQIEMNLEDQGFFDRHEQYVMKKKRKLESSNCSSIS